MNEDTARKLGNGLLIAGLLCFVGGAAMLVTGSPAETTIYALGALGLLFVGTGTAVKNRSGLSQRDQGRFGAYRPNPPRRGI